MLTDLDILASIEAAFGSTERPEHFTDYQCCEECFDHDETLRAKPLERIVRSDLGVVGWNPITFCLPVAKAYLAARLVKELFAEPDARYGWYGAEFLSFLGGAENNDFFDFCNEKQKQSIFLLIQHVIETKSELIEANFCAEEYFANYEKWRPDRK